MTNGALYSLVILTQAKHPLPFHPVYTPVIRTSPAYFETFTFDELYPTASSTWSDVYFSNRDKR